MKPGRSYPPSTPWLFLTPYLVIFGTFMAWPLLRSLILAFEQSYGAKHTIFVGTHNFRFIINDPMFWSAVTNTALFTVLAIVTQVPAALGLALLLNRPDLRGKRFFRLAFFSPSIVGLSFVAIIFGLLLQKRTGLVNASLHSLFPIWNPDFAWREEYVMISIVGASLWLAAGFYMIYFLAALQNVPAELTDAASIDGAGPWQRFRHVTLPEIRPVLNIIILLVITGSFQLFELPFLLYDDTMGSGPENRALTVVTYLYRTGFVSGDLGYASAVGWVLTLFLVGFALLQRRFIKREET